MKCGKRSVMLDDSSNKLVRKYNTNTVSYLRINAEKLTFYVIITEHTSHTIIKLTKH